MNFSSQLFVVNNKPVMLTSSLDLSNICSFDKTVVLAQPALKKTLTYYFRNDGGIKLSFSGVGAIWIKRSKCCQHLGNGSRDLGSGKNN